MAYLDGKWTRNDVSKVLKEYATSDNREETVMNIASNMQQMIVDRQLELEPIRYFERVDGMSKKFRVLGVQHPVHQMLDYVVVRALREMLIAKIGVFQCASLPKRGQSYGKKYIEKWVEKGDVKYFVKGDIRKCFPSIPHDKLMRLIERDVKNPTIVWLIQEMLHMFGDKGISIGSFLSQYLCNYYLSYAYHYAEQDLFKERRKRNGKVERVRLITHMLFYMDDFLLTSNSKKDLKKAMRMMVKYLKDDLGLEVKPWKLCRFTDAEPIDMMGFVFRKEKTTIRTKIFIKTRRYFLKVRKMLKKRKCIRPRIAYQVVSAYGWYKNTNSYRLRKRLKMDEIMHVCKKIISSHTKGEYHGTYTIKNVVKSCGLL